MKNEKQNFDLPFLIFIAVIVVVLVITSVITYLSASKKPIDEIKGSPTPTYSDSPEQSASPTTTPTPVPSDVAASFEYNMPRNPNMSLSTNIKWEISIGGKGTDTISEVITLDKFYLFGTTDSTDFDFSTDGNSDLFYAILNLDGKLENTLTFGSDSSEILLSAKPISKNGVCFLCVTKESSKANSLFIYKVSLDGQAISSAEIKFDDEIQFVKTLSSRDGISILCNLIGEKTQSLIINIDGEMKEKSRISLGDNRIASDFLVTKEGILALVENTSGQSCIEIVSVTQNKDNYETSRTLLSDENRKGIEILPDENGYLIPYYSVVEATKHYGVIHINYNLRLNFDHKIQGENYDNVKVVLDNGAAKLKGYHLFATKYKDLGYATYYENICTHGDLNDYSLELLKEVDIEKSIINGDNILILGNKIKDGKSIFSLTILSKTMNVISDYTFGGTGNDALIGGIITLKGDLVLYGNTSSTNVDITYNFGKSDLWFMCYTE